MAPVLLCPECRTKHPLDSVNGLSAFPCAGCGRTLKVPVSVPAAVPASTPAGSLLPPPPAAYSAPSSAPAADPHATQTLSTVGEPPDASAPVVPPVATPPWVSDSSTPLPGSAPGPGRARPAPTGGTWRDLIPGRTVRFVLWVIAVPLAFFVVFLLAKSVGLLTTNDVSDVALAEGWSRFMPIIRLLPFVALATAGLVHGGVFGIAQLRARRHHSASGTDPSAPSAANRQSSSGRAA